MLSMDEVDVILTSDPSATFRDAVRSMWDSESGFPSFSKTKRCLGRGCGIRILAGGPKESKLRTTGATEATGQGEDGATEEGADRLGSIGGRFRE